jgi:hypothetical protein
MAFPKRFLQRFLQKKTALLVGAVSNWWELAIDRAWENELLKQSLNGERSYRCQFMMFFSEQ